VVFCCFFLCGQFFFLFVARRVWLVRWFWGFQASRWRFVVVGVCRAFPRSPPLLFFPLVSYSPLQLHATKPVFHFVLSGRNPCKDFSQYVLSRLRQRPSLNHERTPDFISLTGRSEALFLNKVPDAHSPLCRLLSRCFCENLSPSTPRALIFQHPVFPDFL